MRLHPPLLCKVRSSRKGCQSAERARKWARTAWGRQNKVDTLSYSTLTRFKETILTRTYGTHKNQYISLFSLTICGSIYYGPPQYSSYSSYASYTSYSTYTSYTSYSSYTVVVLVTAVTWLQCGPANEKASMWANLQAITSQWHQR